MSEPTPADIRKHVSSHGYAFQYSVIRRAQELFQAHNTQWVFEAAEFPVGEAQNTHIDFILKARGDSVYVVAECKRADPALARWCFVKAPYTRRNAPREELIFQEVTSEPMPTESVVTFGAPGYATVSKALRMTTAVMPMSHLGFELRTGVKGDETSKGRAIEGAMTQVLRGMNGFVDHLFRERRTLVRGSRTIMVPVIFTTASLWVAQGDLSTADLATGKLPADWGQVTQTPWLWFNHNQSRALRHGLPPSAELDATLTSRLLQEEYTRTIAIVSPGGLDAFLRADLVSWLL